MNTLDAEWERRKRVFESIIVIVRAMDCHAGFMCTMNMYEQVGHVIKDSGKSVRFLIYK